MNFQEMIDTIKPGQVAHQEGAWWTCHYVADTKQYIRDDVECASGVPVDIDILKNNPAKNPLVITPVFNNMGGDWTIYERAEYLSIRAEKLEEDMRKNGERRERVKRLNSMIEKASSILQKRLDYLQEIKDWLDEHEDIPNHMQYKLATLLESNDT